MHDKSRISQFNRSGDVSSDNVERKKSDWDEDDDEDDEMIDDQKNVDKIKGMEDLM